MAEPGRPTRMGLNKLTRVLRQTTPRVPSGADQEPGPDPADRPRTRGDCYGGERPCPWAACRHHMYLDVHPLTGMTTFNFPHLETWELPETCSLDVADREGATLVEVGMLLNITRERVRQIEALALRRLTRRRAEITGDADDL